MTEQEAIKYLKDANRNNQMVCILPKSDIGKCLVNALEEVQKYRAIGTPDECRTAVEKQIAMKVTDIHVDEYRCPACGPENTTSDALTVGDHYCPNCGQRLE